MTTFIDYFRIPDCFPGYEQSLCSKNANERISVLERAFAADINSPRFIPYIQKHEFESLLFSSDRGFRGYCKAEQLGKIKQVIDAYKNPEDINSSPETSPSNRLKTIILGYNKPTLGNLIALEVGMLSILEKCPRFRHWVDELIQQGQQ